MHAVCCAAAERLNTFVKVQLFQNVVWLLVIVRRIALSLLVLIGQSHLQLAVKRRMGLACEHVIDLPERHGVCHAWDRSRSLLACSHDGPEVVIYRALSKGTLQPVATLTQHNQTVSAMQWSRAGTLVTCSHDRTAYVWQQVRTLALHGHEAPQRTISNACRQCMAGRCCSKIN